MSDTHERRLKSGEKQIKRTVTRLHPTVKVELSPADIDYYRGLGPWAMVLDRQSKKAALTHEEATGQQNRVRNVQKMAEDMGLVLPAPLENPHRQEGEFQFNFDEAACRYHWFVDGLSGDASGFTASPFSRLQLWRAAKIARALRDHGCTPQAVLIGELTRFFRDQKQFLDWYHILKDSGAQIRIYGCPELNSETEEMLLPMYLSQVAALSQWLKKQNQMSRETRRSQGLLFKLTPPFGLAFNLDKSSAGYRREVFADPVEWPLLQSLVARLAARQFATRTEALAWFVEESEAVGIEEKRIPRSRSWLSLLLKGELLLGVYYQYDERYSPCKIEDEEMRSDWDHTARGNRRYIVSAVPEQAVQFPILMTPEMEIPRQEIELARQTICHPGRPRKERSLIVRSPGDSPVTTSLLPIGMIRCVCGYPVLEQEPRLRASNQYDRWTRADDQRLLDLLYEEITHREIADRFNVSKHRIDHRCSAMKFSGRDYALDVARLDHYWTDPFARRIGCWHLYCTCVGRIADERNVAPEEIRDWPIAQHCRKRNGSISLPLEPLLWDALKEEPAVIIGAPRPRPSGSMAALEADEARLVARIRKIQQDSENDDWTFYTKEEAAARLFDLRQDRARIQAEIAGLKGTLLDKNDNQELVAWEEVRRELCRMMDHPRFTEGVEFRRRLVQLCVKRIEVDLETGVFQVETQFRAEPLRRLCGHVLLGVSAAVDADKDTSPQIAVQYGKNRFLTGHVRLAA